MLPLPVPWIAAVVLQKETEADPRADPQAPEAEHAVEDRGEDDSHSDVWALHQQPNVPEVGEKSNECKCVKCWKTRQDGIHCIFIAPTNNLLAAVVRLRNKASTA